MKAALLSIGTELTRGELTNTNAQWLAERLTAMGCDVGRHVTVPDTETDIVEVVRRLAQDHSAIVSTGGLGPTTDDLTAAAVARALDVAIERNANALEAIEARYADLGRAVTEVGASMADLPEGAQILGNAVGTAPGFRVEVDGALAFFLPGVPHEMRRIFEDHVSPALSRKVERRTHQVRLRTFGLPESEVGERLSGLEDAHPGLTLGFRAGFPEVEVKVCVTLDSLVEAETQARAIADEVRERLGDSVFGEEGDTYPAYVGRVLRDRGLTVAVAESCTGGMVGSLLTEVPGSSNYLLVDAVTYSNAAKSKLLGVSEDVLRAYGAVSSECAIAMADGARRLGDADLAVSITGVAGPGGGTDEKPVGTVWMGLARRGVPAESTLHSLTGDRTRVRRRAAYLALRTLVRAALDR